MENSHCCLPFGKADDTAISSSCVHKSMPKVRSKLLRLHLWRLGSAASSTFATLGYTLSLIDRKQKGELRLGLPHGTGSSRGILDFQSIRGSANPIFDAQAGYFFKMPCISGYENKIVLYGDRCDSQVGFTTNNALFLQRRFKLTK